MKYGRYTLNTLIAFPFFKSEFSKKHVPPFLSHSLLISKYFILALNSFKKDYKELSEK
jgi:hypothetical protein